MNNFRNNSETAERAICGDKDAFEELILSNLGLVKSIVKRFSGRGTDYDDLVQIGSVGLIKAAKAYRPELGYEFSTYAFSMITGELRRHFRDDGIIKVSRTVKKNCALILSEKEKYLSMYGTEPSVSYIAHKCGMSFEDAVFALGALSPVESLNSSSDDEEMPLEEKIGTDNIEEFTELFSLKQAISLLSAEERIIIELRYRMSLTQAETAKRLGYTQVKISRMEKKIIDKLKNYLL